MRKLFSGYYRPLNEEIEELWSNCIFIFDTSSLLNLYRYSKESRSTLINVLHMIESRIWIPYQVALEYHKNLHKEILNQKNEYSVIKKTIVDSLNAIEKELNEKRHSNIKVEVIIKGLKEFQEKAEIELKAQEEGHPDLEKIKEQLNAIIGEKVGGEFSQEKLNEIFAEGTKRYDAKIPPGYMDYKKESRSYYSNLEYEDKFGDLVYWKQILEKSKEEVVKSIILITDDTKEDWWYEVKGQKKGPHPLLVQEFKNESGNKLFYMYRTEQFLKMAEKYLKINNIEQVDKAVSEIEKIKDAAGEYPIEKLMRINNNHLFQFHPLLHKEFELNLNVSYIYDYRAALEINKDIIGADSDGIAFVIKMFMKAIKEYHLSNTLLINNYSEREGYIVILFSASLSLGDTSDIMQYINDSTSFFKIVSFLSFGDN